MFLEAEVVSQVTDNEELYYLAALNAADTPARQGVSDRTDARRLQRRWLGLGSAMPRDKRLKSTGLADGLTDVKMGAMCPQT